jgi:X-X-X-Leu-X-X-Gly heptad repeat protein
MNTAFGTFFAVAAMPLAGQWLNYPTPGIPRLSDGSANLSAKAPKLADGTPDLSGVWPAKCGIYDGSRCFVQSYYFDLAQDLPAEAVRMTPWAEGVARQRASRNHVDDAYGYCLPPGVPRIDFGGGDVDLFQMGVAFRVTPNAIQARAIGSFLLAHHGAGCERQHGQPEDGSLHCSSHRSMKPQFVDVRNGSRNFR